MAPTSTWPRWQMALAGWGEILLDATTARQAQAEFHVIEHGWHPLKGFAEQQQIFRLDQQQTATAQSAYPTPMIGRQHALDELWQAIQPLFQGKFGGVITITGEALASVRVGWSMNYGNEPSLPKRCHCGKLYNRPRRRDAVSLVYLPN